MLKESPQQKVSATTHSPTLDSILMVESAIKNSNLPPSKMQLWRSLPRKMMYQTFVGVLDYLEASNKILFDGKVRFAVESSWIVGTPILNILQCLD